MTERSYRLILGVLIWLAAFFEYQPLEIAIVLILLMEGLFNWRVPILVSRWFYPEYNLVFKTQQGSRFSFEAERMLRLVVAVLLAISMMFFPKLLWYIPWFVALMLVLSGITSMCPLVIGLRWLGFR